MPDVTALPRWGRVLVVVAHPDDESFALGALLDGFVEAGADVSVLCLTRGEASTLGAGATDLSVVRDTELRAAAAELGVRRTTLLTHPDGRLPQLDPTVLEVDVEAEVAAVGPDGILVFDPDAGVTGHGDHRSASLAAVTVARRHGIPVIGWALPAAVADRLNAEYGAAFAGHAPEGLTEVPVTRERQLTAVHRHTSQAVPGSVLWRRLELLGDREFIRRLGP